MTRALLTLACLVALFLMLATFGARFAEAGVKWPVDIPSASWST